MRLDNLTNLLNRAFSRPTGKDLADTAPRKGLAAHAPSHAPLKDEVSLSDTAKALQKQDATGGLGQMVGASLDMAQQVLGALTGRSLSILGLVKPEDVAGAKISFDSVSMDASSSSSLTYSHQLASGQGQDSNTSTSLVDSERLQFHSEQQLKFAGKGHIVTADGREFEFEATLEISTAITVEQSQTTMAAMNQPAAPNNTPAAASPAPIVVDFAGTAAQLMDQLRKASGDAAKSPLNFWAQDPAKAKDDPTGWLLGSLDMQLKDDKGQVWGGIDWQKLQEGVSALLNQGSAAPATNKLQAYQQAE